MAIIFAIACVLLSMWQFSRREEAVAAIVKVQQNYDHESVALESALPSLSSYSEKQEWLPVTMTGIYVPNEQLLVRNRPYNGQPGFEVLTPLQLANGDVFIVDRGWLPTGDKQDSPDSIPEAPSGTVTVVARLKASEPSLPGRSAPAGQVATIQLAEVAKLIDQPMYTGAYGLLSSEDPAAAVTPAPAVKPQLDEGSHLSYAVQWIAFALLGFGGLWFAIRQEYRIRNSEVPEERVRAEKRARKAAAKAPTDSDIEDAILDSVKR
jgi:cytochrome oxidase assembly protein ShyY1